MEKKDGSKQMNEENNQDKQLRKGQKKVDTEVKKQDNRETSFST